MDLGQDDTKKLKRYLVSLQSTTLRERGDLSPPACFEWEDWPMAKAHIGGGLPMDMGMRSAFEAKGRCGPRLSPAGTVQDTFGG